MIKELTREELALQCPVTFADVNALAVNNGGSTVNDVIRVLVDIQFAFADKVMAMRSEKNKC